jgi:hypothetical protein
MLCDNQIENRLVLYINMYISYRYPPKIEEFIWYAPKDVFPTPLSPSITTLYRGGLPGPPTPVFLFDIFDII